MFHFHHWKAQAAEHCTVRTVFEKPGTGSDVTMVLLRCECGDVRTKKIDGHWTLEQIRGAKN